MVKRTGWPSFGPLETLTFIKTHINLSNIHYLLPRLIKSNHNLTFPRYFGFITRHFSDALKATRTHKGTRLLCCYIGNIYFLLLGTFFRAVTYSQF